MRTGMQAELRELKERMLKLLEEDREFRYAVAGYLGILEVLKRLDGIEAEQAKLRAETTRIWEEIACLREDFNKRFEAHERELKALREDMNALREDFNRMRKDFNRMQMTIEGILRELKSMDARLTRVERTLEKLTIDIEEEARSIVAHRLKQMGYEIRLTRLQLPGVEINLYGATGDLCVIGECSVRATPRLLEELKRKYEFLRRARPDLLRPRVLLVIYASLALPELIEAAEREGIWVLKATEDYTPCPLKANG